MPAVPAVVVPLLTLLLVSRDEVAQVVVRSTENSQYETGWKEYSLAKESYFEGYYVPITSSGISFNGLKLAHVVDGRRVFLQTNGAGITFVSDLDQASAFHILGESTNKEGNLEKFHLGYIEGNRRSMLHVEYSEGGNAILSLRAPNRRAGTQLVTCISICKA